MKILLDTHAFLWAAHHDRRLSPCAEKLFQGDHELLLSAASYWEIAVKFKTGKLKLESGPAAFMERYASLHPVKKLAIDFHHIDQLEALPLHHQDPFDRLLIAQAFAEKVPILTNDRQFRRYDVEVIW